ncbi:hypothetical protein KKF32_00870 [Patescibacteria group bacterium]|nr:hypothetical protein [Patescibacteria group bacterium]
MIFNTSLGGFFPVPTSEEPSEAEGLPKVIVVESDVEVLGPLAQLVFLLSGSEVICMDSADDGMALLSNLSDKGQLNQVALVLTCLQMNGNGSMDGLAFERWLRLIGIPCCVICNGLNGREDFASYCDLVLEETSQAFRLQKAGMILVRPFGAEEIRMILIKYCFLS